MFLQVQDRSGAPSWLVEASYLRPWLSRIEQRFPKPWAGGSSPSGRTIITTVSHKQLWDLFFVYTGIIEIG